MQSPTFTWYPLVPLTAHFAPFADRIACRCQPRTALKALEAADRIPFCPPRITESGHYATIASPTTRQIYFLSSLPAKPSQLSALPRRSDSILPLFKRFPRKRRPIFSLQLRSLTVLLLPDPAPPFQSWFSHSFPSASADMYLWSCTMLTKSWNPYPATPPPHRPEGSRIRRPHPFLSAPHHRKRSLCHDCFANSKTDLLPFIAPRQALTAVRSSPAFRFDSPPFQTISPQTAPNFLPAAAIPDCPSPPRSRTSIPILVFPLVSLSFCRYVPVELLRC